MQLVSRKGAVSLLMLGALLSVESVISCEPSADIGLYARAIGFTERSSDVLVTVELTIVPRRDLEPARVHGWVAGGIGFDVALGVQDRTETLRRGVARKLQYELPLEKGRDHHLFFGVGPGGDPAAGDLTTAWLRVNLDPSRQPEDLGDLLQYRAVTGGR